MIGVLFIVLVILTACSGGHPYQQAPFDGRKVVIETGGLKDGIPVFYTFEGINFFIIKTGDKVRAYLDACQECYIHRRGFRYEEGALICNYCNIRHPVGTLDRGQGRCHPIRLKGRLKGHLYEIDKDQLLERQGYF
jgi:uncharacterized membrane protein